MFELYKNEFYRDEFYRDELYRDGFTYDGYYENELNEIDIDIDILIEENENNTSEEFHAILYDDLYVEMLERGISLSLFKLDVDSGFSLISNYYLNLSLIQTYLSGDKWDYILDFNKYLVNEKKLELSREVLKEDIFDLEVCLGYVNYNTNDLKLIHGFAGIISAILIAEYC